ACCSLCVGADCQSRDMARPLSEVSSGWIPHQVREDGGGDLCSTPALAVMSDERSEDPVPKAKQLGGTHSVYLMSALVEEALVSML
ncbi:hypothetical protein, partial [Pseudovibrio sp. W74]|uniref:hypothetical protein n=1 Tax=Pseudovibrio sp. W74 TaxID=1735584 RepID=UPI0019D40CEE